MIVVDWIMRMTTTNTHRGLRWAPTKQLEDLDFADDISLLSHSVEDAQLKLARLSEVAEQVGLKINVDKTQTMILNLSNEHLIELRGRELTAVERFSYLGSVVSMTGGTDEDVRARIAKAQFAFSTLRPIWTSSALSLCNKIRIFNSNVKAVLLYGCETWRETKATTNKLQVFVNKCLRSILRIRWPERISNSDLWRKTKQNPIRFDILKRKWSWLGHTLRKSEDNVARQALEWNPPGKRKVGRPRQSWKRTLGMEIRETGLPWAQLKQAAQNRVRWRKVVAALCSSRSQKE
jgi:hypothetical protein